MLTPILTPDGRVVEPVPARRRRRGLFVPSPQRIIVPGRHPRFRSRHAPHCPARRRELVMMAAGDSVLNASGDEVLDADGETALDCSCCAACPYCGSGQAPCITAVLSGVTGCPCRFYNHVTAGCKIKTTIIGFNGTYPLVTPGDDFIGHPNTVPCCWTATVLPIPNWVTFWDNGCSFLSPEEIPEGCPFLFDTLDTVPEVPGFLGHAAVALFLSVCNLGGGLVGASGFSRIIAPGDGIPLRYTWFAGTATTTVENACTFEEPVTFENEADCDPPVWISGFQFHSIGNIAHGGTMTVARGC